MTGRIPQGVPAETPQSFLDFYARYPHLRRADEPVTLPWSKPLGRAIVKAYRRLKSGDGLSGDYKGFWHDGTTDSVLHNAKEVEVKGGWALKGNCSDFAPHLIEDLMDSGLPRGSLSLLVGWVNHRDGTTENHMTTAIETSLGTAICCVVAGCKHYGHPWFANQSYTYREGHPGFYRIPLSLADHLERLRA